MADVIIVEAPNGIAGMYRNEIPNAHNCIPSWCVQFIESSYGWGSYAETITKVTKNTTIGVFPWTTTRVESKTLNGTDI
jgi:hypothetical protein